MKRAVSLLFYAFLLLLSLAYVAQAAPALTVSTKGQGNFVLEGSGFQNVATIDVVVTYDTSRLSSPKVTKGSLISSALMAENVNVPGRIRIGIVSVSPINGSGPLATITFTVSGAGAATPSVTASYTDPDGKPLGSLVATATDGTKPGEPTDQPSITLPPGGTDKPLQPEPPAVTTGTPTYLGEVTMPKDEAAPEKKGEAPPAEGELTAGEKAVPQEAQPSPSAGRPEEAKPATAFPAIRGALERFRLFTGEKSPGNLVPLLAPEGGGHVVQEPAIALSDGKKAVKITVEIADATRKSPNFVFTGASLKSLKKGAGNIWVIEALPKKEAFRANLSIVVNGKTTEIPLTVAPPVETDLDGKGGVTEDDFKLFLKERGTEKAPKFDLNRDGKRDYIDDYIYAANYVLKQKVKEKEKKGAEKKK